MLPEGQWYTPGYGSRMMIARFMHGASFAEMWAQRNLRLGGARVRDRRDRGDLVAQANQMGNQGLARNEYTAGEVTLDAVMNGTPVSAWILASTNRLSMQGMAQWFVTGPAYWVAPQGQEATAMAVLDQLARSFRVNQSWFYANQRHVGQVSATVTETGEAISRAISSSYWSRQRAQDRSNQNFSDYMRGVQRVRDPETGEEFEGRAGSNYYWRNRRDNNPNTQIMGTDQAGADQILDVSPLERIG